MGFDLIGKRLVFFIVVIVFYTFKAQAQHYEAGIQVGLFTAPQYGVYREARPGYFAGIVFDYHFNEKLALSSHFQFGEFDYAPEQTSILTVPDKGKMRVHLFYWALQRKFSIGNQWTLAAGTGPGFFLANHLDERNPDTGFGQFSRDFAMPLLLNFRKPIGTSGAYGIKTGLFFTPFYAIGGFHIGPEFRYRF